MGARSHSVRYFDKYFRYPLSNLHVYDSGELDQLIGHHSPKMLVEKEEIWQEISAAKFYTTWKKSSSKFIYNNQQTNNKKDNSTNSNPTKKTAWATTAATKAKSKVLRLQEVKLTVKILLLLLHVAKEF